MMAGATSAAAFVEGGVQDACDDACSICLENFCEDDPSTITSCKHEYHLQCILEWSQRSKECPMCWQPLSLKNPDSQTLLAASEQERMAHCQRSSSFYQRSARDETDIHRVRFGVSYGDDSDLEDRIMQHLAAAAMGRAQHFARRGESMRFRTSHDQGIPHIMVTPARSNSSSAQLSSTAVSFAGGVSPPSPASVQDRDGSESTSEHAALRWSASGYSHSISERSRGSRSSDSSSMVSSSIRQVALLERPEEIQLGTTPDPSLSETFKSRLVAASSKYRDSLSKTTRGLRERLRLRNGAIAELGARAREVSAGVVRALEQISREPAERESMISPSSSADRKIQIGTTSVQSGPSCVSDGSGQNCTSSSSGEAVNVCSVTPSSIPNVCQPTSAECSRCLDSKPVKGLDREEGSGQGCATRQTPSGPMPV